MRIVLCKLLFSLPLLRVLFFCTVNISKSSPDTNYAPLKMVTTQFTKRRHMFPLEQNAVSQIIHLSVALDSLIKARVFATKR